MTYREFYNRDVINHIFLKITNATTDDTHFFWLFEMEDVLKYAIRTSLEKKTKRT